MEYLIIWLLIGVVAFLIKKPLAFIWAIGSVAVFVFISGRNDRQIIEDRAHMGATAASAAVSVKTGAEKLFGIPEQTPAKK